MLLLQARQLDSSKLSNYSALLNAGAIALPPSVRWVADNYNHLTEAPTLFYAAMNVVALACPTNGTAFASGWAYVALRVLHSLLQALVNHIPTRLALFVISTLALGVVVWQGASCDVSIGCSPGRFWEAGVTTLQHSQRKQPGEQP